MMMHDPVPRSKSSMYATTNLTLALTRTLTYTLTHIHTLISTNTHTRIFTWSKPCRMRCSVAALEGPRNGFWP